jgi:hypothetical protein
MMVTEKEYRHTRWADEAALREGFAGSALDQKKSHWIKLLTEAGNNEKSQEVKEYVRRELERVWDEYDLLPVRCHHLQSRCQVEQLHIFNKDGHLVQHVLRAFCLASLRVRCKLALTKLRTAVPCIAYMRCTDVLPPTFDQMKQC